MVTNLFNNILKSKEMADEWRIRILVPPHKKNDKKDIQSRTNYCG